MDLLWTIGIGTLILGTAFVVIGLLWRFVLWVWKGDNIGF